MSTVTSPPGVDPTPDTDGTSAPMQSFATQTSTTSESGISPYLYFYIVTGIWILLFLIWIPVLVIGNRRIQQWTEQHKNTQRQQQQLDEESSVSGGGADRHQDSQVVAVVDAKKFQRQQSNGQTIILVLLILASVMALALAIVTHLSCDFISLSSPVYLDWIPVGQREDGSYIQVELTTMGLWAFGSSNTESYLEPNYYLQMGKEDDSCFDAGPDESWLLGLLGSGQFQTARVSSVIASILGGSCLLFFIWSACNPSRRTRVRYLGLPLLLATILQSLPNVLFQTEPCTSMSGDCSLSFGGTTNVSAVMFWFFATLAAAAFPPIVGQASLERELPNVSEP